MGRDDMELEFKLFSGLLLIVLEFRFFLNLSLATITGTGLVRF